MVLLGRSSRRVGRVVGVVVVTVAVCAGCGSAAHNAEEARAPSQIFNDAKAATAGASSVRVSGTGAPGGSLLRIDVVAGRGRGGGTITTQGATLQLVLGNNKIYLRGDQASLATLTGDASRASSLANQWLESSAGDTALGGIGQLLMISELPQQFKPQGALTKQAETTFNGVKVIPLRDASTGATLYVAATGRPYIEGVKGGSGTTVATLTFSDYDTARPPAIPTRSTPIS